MRSNLFVFIFVFVNLTFIFVVAVSVGCQFDRVMQKVESTIHGPRPTHIFQVIQSPQSVAEERFRKHLVGDRSTVYAYHGSKIESFHSIMNYGLQQHLCKNALFGDGIYLSSESHVSLHFSPIGSGWDGSRFGKELSCLALCEFVKHPLHLECHTKDNTKKKSTVPDKYFVVTNNEIVRLRYLLVYGRDERLTQNPARTLHTHRNPLIHWILSHKSVAAIILYAFILLWIGVSNSRNGYYLRQWFWRTATDWFERLKKFNFTSPDHQPN